MAFGSFIPFVFYHLYLNHGVFLESSSQIKVSELDRIEPDPLARVKVDSGDTYRLYVSCTGVGVGLDGNQNSFCLGVHEVGSVICLILTRSWLRLTIS